MTVGERRKVNTGWGERQHMEIEQSEVTEDGKRRKVEIRTFCLETYISIVSVTVPHTGAAGIDPRSAESPHEAWILNITVDPGRLCYR